MLLFCRRSCTAFTQGRPMLVDMKLCAHRARRFAMASGSAQLGSHNKKEDESIYTKRARGARCPILSLGGFSLTIWTEFQGFLGQK